MIRSCNMPACISFGALFPCIPKKSNSGRKLNVQETVSKSHLDDPKKNIANFKKDVSVMADDKDTQEFVCSSAEQRDIHYRLRGDIGVVLGASNSHSPTEDNTSDHNDSISSKTANGVSTGLESRLSPQLPLFEPRSSPHTIFSGQCNSPDSTSASMFAPGGPCDSPVTSPSTAHRPQRVEDINCELERNGDLRTDKNVYHNLHVPTADEAFQATLPHDVRYSIPVPAEKGGKAVQAALKSSEDVSRASVHHPASINTSANVLWKSPDLTASPAPPGAPGAADALSSAVQPGASAGARHIASTPSALSSVTNSPAAFAASVAAASVAAAAASGKRGVSPSVVAQHAQLGPGHRFTDVPSAPGSSVQSWMQLDPAAPPPTVSKTPSVAAAAATPYRPEPPVQMLVHDNDERCKVRPGARRFFPIFCGPD